MKYDIIATGSQGNATVLDNCILVDCGVSFKALQPYYKSIKLVLLSHEHSDHLNKTTVRTLAKERPLLRFGCGPWLLNYLIECGVSKSNIDVYEYQKVYDYGILKLIPFRLFHDVPNCGYKLRFKSGEQVIYATDTNSLQGITAKNFDLYLIEANYEEDELEERIAEKVNNDTFAYEIRVRNTHLSKEQCDEFLLDNMKESSEYHYMHQHQE